MLQKTNFFFLCSFLFGFNKKDSGNIPVIFPEYRVEIYAVPYLGDTLSYRVSGKEDFRFVFFDKKGKCYCERYVNKKLYQKGFYENSLDTLKRYVSSRASSGQHSSIRVQQYFQPLKNGEWVTYKDGDRVKENYLMGVLQQN